MIKKSFHDVSKKSWRAKLRQFCDEPLSGRLARITNWFLTICIILSVVAYILSSMNVLCQQLYTPCALAGEDSNYHSSGTEFHRHEILKEAYCFELMKRDPTYAHNTAVMSCSEEKWRNNECEAQNKMEANDEMWDFWKSQNQTCIPPPNNLRRIPLHAVSVVGAHDTKIYCENSFPAYMSNGEAFWFACNVFFSVVFLIEIILRGIAAKNWFCADKNLQVGDDIFAAKPFFRDAMNWFDILAIMPLFIRIPYIILQRAQPTLMSAFGLLRVFRMFKILRHFEGTKVIVRTFRLAYFPLLVSLYFVGLIFIVLSFLIFVFESCIDKECTFTDPMNTIYYCVITILTVGYGDQIPDGILGRLVGAFIMIMGSFYLAMPLSIIGNIFDQVYLAEQNEQKKNRGEKLEGPETLPIASTKERILSSSYQLLSVVSKMRDLHEVHDDADGLSAVSGHAKTKKSCLRFKELHTVLKNDIERVFLEKQPKSLRLGESKDAGAPDEDSDNIPTWVYPPGYSSWVSLHREASEEGTVYYFEPEDGEGTMQLEEGMPVSFGDDKPVKPPNLKTARFHKRAFSCFRRCRSKQSDVDIFDRLSIAHQREGARIINAKERAKKGSCADKLYVLMNEEPKSNCGTRACTKLRSFVSVLSICVCMLQTTGVCNIYGPAKEHCVKQAVAWCNVVEMYGGQTQYQYQDAMQLGNPKDHNKNCYPQKCCSVSTIPTTTTPNSTVTSPTTHTSTTTITSTSIVTSFPKEESDIPALFLPRTKREDGSYEKACLRCAPGWTNITYGGMLKKDSHGNWVSRTLEEIAKDGYPFSHVGLEVDITCPTVESSDAVEEITTRGFATKKKVTKKTTGKPPFAADFMSRKLMNDNYYGALDFCARRQCASNAGERVGIFSAWYGDESFSNMLKWDGETLKQRHINTVWAFFELFFCIFFLVEFVLRLAATQRNPPRPSYPGGPLPPDQAGVYKFTNEADYQRAVARGLPGLKEFFSNYYNILELVSTFCCILELLLVTSDLGAFQYEPWGMPFHPYLNRSLLRPLRVIVMTRYISMQRSTHGFRVLRLTLAEVYQRLIIPLMFLILISVLFAGLFYTFETILDCEVQSKSLFDETSEILWVLKNDTLAGTKGDTCQLQNMFDAWWLSFVTLTAVGYGRISPVTTVGRGLAMVTGVVGTFYMAMPLSIVGTKFYDIYGRLNELVSRKTKKLRNLAIFAGLLKRSAVKNHHIDLLAEYKNDIEVFCSSKALYSVETVDRASIAETQARLENLIEYVAQNYALTHHEMESRIM